MNKSINLKSKLNWNWILLIDEPSNRCNDSWKSTSCFGIRWSNQASQLRRAFSFCWPCQRVRKANVWMRELSHSNKWHGICGGFAVDLGFLLHSLLPLVAVLQGEVLEIKPVIAIFLNAICVLFSEQSEIAHDWWHDQARCGIWAIEKEACIDNLSNNFRLDPKPSKCKIRE